MRIRRLDDVLALNEQLNEVGTMLSTLLSAPLYRAPITTVAGLAATNNPAGTVVVYLCNYYNQVKE